MRRRVICASLRLCVVLTPAAAQPAPKVIDIPTRPGVTQRLLVLSPAEQTVAWMLAR